MGQASQSTSSTLLFLDTPEASDPSGQTTSCPLRSFQSGLPPQGQAPGWVMGICSPRMRLLLGLL